LLRGVYPELYQILPLHFVQGFGSHAQNDSKRRTQSLQEELLNDIKMTVNIKIGDVVRLRKPHPCGSYEWEVVRVGADIGLKCLKCQRRILLERSVFERRLKEVVSKSD